MRRRDEHPPAPWAWITASAMVLGALGFAAWRLRAPPPAVVTLDEAAWATAVRPALAARCGACHTERVGALRFAREPRATDVIEELARARALVVPGAPAQSPLRRRALGEAHPAVLSPGSCEAALLDRWISGDAVRRCPPPLQGIASPASPDPTLDLSSPARTVATQAALLRAARYDALRETFTNASQLQLTERVLEGCRLRVVSHGSITPNDGEGPVMEDGHPVRRVRVLRPDDPPTAFHLLGGRWLADAPWCAPLPLPAAR